eukprot:6377792-Amphidinium_carterae.2
MPCDVKVTSSVDLAVGFTPDIETAFKPEHPAQSAGVWDTDPAKDVDKHYVCHSASVDSYNPLANSVS